MSGKRPQMPRIPAQATAPTLAAMCITMCATGLQTTAGAVVGVPLAAANRRALQ